MLLLGRHVTYAIFRLLVPGTGTDRRNQHMLAARPYAPLLHRLGYSIGESWPTVGPMV